MYSTSNEMPLNLKVCIHLLTRLSLITLILVTWASLIWALNHCFKTKDSQMFQSFMKQWFESNSISRRGNVVFTCFIRPFRFVFIIKYMNTEQDGFGLLYYCRLANSLWASSCYSSVSVIWVKAHVGSVILLINNSSVMNIEKLTFYRH